MTSFQERIRRERGNMSKSFARLADYLLDSYTEASFMTASELAHVLNLDAATVVRFAQFLGYPGFPQLQQEIRQKVRQEILQRPAEGEAVQTAWGAASAVLRDLIKDLENTRLALDPQALEDLLGAVSAARRVFLIADSAALPAARLLAEGMEEVGISASLVELLPEALARLLHTAAPQDVILAFDVTGAYPLLSRALEEARARDIPAAVIAGAGSYASARQAAWVLAAQPRSPRLPPFVLVSALAAALAQALYWRFGKLTSSDRAEIAQLVRHLQSEL